MIPGISTQVFLSQKLDTAALDALKSGGAQAIELWAARWHVDYTDRTQMREIAAWFRGGDTLATLHAPLTADTMFSRHGSTPLNLVDADRSRRIAAMDEVKRALEIAEHFPVQSCVVHLGVGADHSLRWSERTLEFALVAVEHLKAFAGPLGTRLLLENLRNDIATPEHLLEVLRTGHFESCGVCLDTGHTHLDQAGLQPTLELLRARIAEVHVNDNDGRGDTHLWPTCEGERPGWAAAGTLDWRETWLLLSTLPPETLAILEVAETPGTQPAEVSRMLAHVLGWMRRTLDEAPAREGTEPGVKSQEPRVN